MAQSIAGGAYLVGDRWIDANGKPLTKHQIDQAEALHAQQAEERAEQERQAREVDAQRDPTARAIAAALAPRIVAQQAEAQTGEKLPSEDDEPDAPPAAPKAGKGLVK